MIAAAHQGAFSFDRVEPGAGLARTASLSRSDILQEVRASGIRGRGGAGFPVAVKWNLCAAASGDRKFIICNADEGEPGTFKDRVILTDYADLVFEGMTIGGMATGSTEGIVYLRAEYTYLRAHLEAVLERRRAAGLLGEDAAGRSGFCFDIRIQMGAGAYVCGEETALIESLEGHRGEPRNRPPFPVDTGFLGRPTAVNNVETLAWVACIFHLGAHWFAEQGTDRSTGPKLFSVSGDVQRPGVYELSMGTTISELLDVVGAKDPKGVQVGGASGHMVPRSGFGRRICYEDVATGGSVMVFGEHRDMLRVAHNFMDFFVDESCGQCTPCRLGCAKLLDGLERLQRGECSAKYLEELCALGQTMQLASKCGLGQSAPNAFLSIVEHYQDELLGRQA